MVLWVDKWGTKRTQSKQTWKSTLWNNLSLGNVLQRTQKMKNSYYDLKHNWNITITHIFRALPPSQAPQLRCVSPDLQSTTIPGFQQLRGCSAWHPAGPKVVCFFSAHPEIQLVSSPAAALRLMAARLQNLCC